MRGVLAALLILSAAMPLAAAERIEEVAAGGLSGTLVVPDAVVRPPVALIIAGSGPTDRDGTGPGVAFPYLRRLAEALAENGIASLRYDKRGVGNSRSAATPEERLRVGRFVDDVAIWADWLRRRSDVGAIVLAGHSEGGLIGSLAAPHVEPRALVVINGPGRKFAQVLREQLQPALPSALRDEALTILSALEHGERVAAVSPELAPLFRPGVQPYLMSLLPIDPADALAAVPAPVMIVSGGRDLQLGAADAEALVRARPDARRWHDALMNHVLAAAPSDRAGNLQLYGDANADVVSGLAHAIAVFIADVVKHP